VRYADNHLRLWTLQPVALWEKAQRTSWLRCDGRRVERGYRVPYAWLRKQMLAAIPGYSGRTPVWAWQAPKPDLRKHPYRHYVRGMGKCVSIEFVAAPRSVLLSDYQSWEALIMGDFVSTCAKEAEAFDDEYFAADLGDPVVHANFQRRIRESWPRVFDLSAANYIQAVIEEVHISQVRRVKCLRPNQ